MSFARPHKLARLFRLISPSARPMPGRLVFVSGPGLVSPPAAVADLVWPAGSVDSADLAARRSSAVGTGSVEIAVVVGFDPVWIDRFAEFVVAPVVSDPGPFGQIYPALNCSVVVVAVSAPLAAS